MAAVWGHQNLREYYSGVLKQAESRAPRLHLCPDSSAQAREGPAA